MTKRCGVWRRLLEIVMVAGLFADPVFGDGMDQRRAAELENLVRQDCGSCHGMTLKGGLGRPLTPDRLQDVPAEGLARIILDGVPGTPMPPWAGLISEEEAMWIAEHLRRGLAQ